MRPPIIRMRSPRGVLYEVEAHHLLHHEYLKGHVTACVPSGTPITLEVLDEKNAHAWQFAMPAPNAIDGEVIDAEATLPPDALPDIEVAAARVHAAWVTAKLAQGITSRKSESGEELMVPYDQLTDAAKELDRATVRGVYAAIEGAK